jgi:SlyX protein
MQSNDERIEAFETKLAFQDDTVQQLNDALVEQQSRIDQLELSLRALLKRLDESADDLRPPPDNERPPHY